MKRKYLATLPMQRIIIMLINVVVCSCHRHAMGVEGNAYSQGYKKMDRAESNESLISTHTKQLKNEIVTVRQLLEEMDRLTLWIFSIKQAAGIKKWGIGRKLAIGSVAAGGAVFLIYLMNYWMSYYSLPSTIDFDLYTRKVQASLAQLDDFCALDNAVDAVKNHIQWYVGRMKDLLFEQGSYVRDFETYAKDLVDEIKYGEYKKYDSHHMVDSDIATITWFKNLTLNLVERFGKIARWEEHGYNSLTQGIAWDLDKNRHTQTYNGSLYNVRSNVQILIDNSNKVNGLNSNLLWKELLWLSSFLFPPLAYFGWEAWQQSSTNTNQNEMLRNEVCTLSPQLLNNYVDLESKSKKDFREEDQKRIAELRNNLLDFCKKFIKLIKSNINSSHYESLHYECLNEALERLHRKMQDVDLSQTNKKYQKMFKKCISKIDAIRKQIDPKAIQSATWKTKTEEVKFLHSQ